MRSTRYEFRARAAVAGFAVMLMPLLTLVAATTANAKTYSMKIGMATINDAQNQWCNWFVSSVNKDSHGQIKGQCYPASQLGPIPREIEGVQFNEIQGYIGPPEFLVGVDDRYEVLSAPGFVDSMAQGVRMADDPQLQKLVLGFGANKGLHGVAVFVSQPNWVIARKPIRTLSDFKGMKIRVLSADMQQDMITGLGGTPVALSLGDVLPALQQGTIDGALSGMTIFTTMHYWDAAKSITETGQPFIFSMAFLSKKWFDSLPKNLQTILDTDALKDAARVNPWAVALNQKARKVWVQNGGKLIKLSPDDHAKMMKELAGVAANVATHRPDLKPALDVFAAVAKRTEH